MGTQKSHLGTQKSYLNFKAIENTSFKGCLKHIKQYIYKTYKTTTGLNVTFEYICHT